MHWQKHWPEKQAYVKRVMLKNKDSIHYDIYDHSTKIIHK